MLNLVPFAIDHTDYTIVQLPRQDSDRLQALYVAYTDFFWLTEGTAPSPTAAQDEFTDVPEGKPPMICTCLACAIFRNGSWG